VGEIEEEMSEQQQQQQPHEQRFEQLEAYMTQMAQRSARDHQDLIQLIAAQNNLIESVEIMSNELHEIRRTSTGQHRRKRRWVSSDRPERSEVFSDDQEPMEFEQRSGKAEASIEESMEMSMEIPMEISIEQSHESSYEILQRITENEKRKGYQDRRVKIRFSESEIGVIEKVASLKREEKKMKPKVKPVLRKSKRTRSKSAKKTRVKRERRLYDKVRKGSDGRWIAPLRNRYVEPPCLIKKLSEGQYEFVERPVQKMQDYVMSFIGALPQPDDTCFHEFKETFDSNDIDYWKEQLDLCIQVKMCLLLQKFSGTRRIRMSIELRRKRKLINEHDMIWFLNKLHWCPNVGVLVNEVWTLLYMIRMELLLCNYSTLNKCALLELR